MSADAGSAGLIAARAMLQRHAFGDAEKLASELIADTQDAEAYCIRGEARANQSQFETARDDFIKAIRLAPHNFTYRFNYGICLQTMGAVDQAIVAYRDALEFQPGNPEVLIRLAGALISNAHYADAIQILESMLRNDDKNAFTWNSLGVALQFSGRLEEAAHCYEKCVSLAPEFVDAHSNLGTAFQGLRELDRAERSFRRALDLDPAHQDALAGMASLMDWQGRYEEGLALIGPTVDRGSRHPELLVSWASLMRHNQRHEEAIGRLQSTLVDELPSTSYKQRLSFLLGDMFNDLGKYDAAFEAYRAGNELKGAQFDRAAHDRMVDLSIAYFTPEKIAQHRIENGGEGMVFIVGMPRSGTSLSEQILAAHPKVHAGGELTYLFDLSATIEKAVPPGNEYPKIFDIADRNLLTAATQEIEFKIRQGSDHATRYTDKMPSNFIYLGVINMLFPRARVIHISRDPLDVCLSCYFQNFSSRGMHFAFDLGDIASYYRSYRRLIKHFRDVIDIEFMELTYEDLVGDTEAQMRRMVDFSGLDWDPACLEFHRLGRTVVTASHAQVRKPIYKSSAGRHENYREYLGPLVKGLGELIDEPRP